MPLCIPLFPGVSSSSPVVQLTCYQLTHLCHCIPLPAVSSPAPFCMTLPAINSPVPLCIPLFPGVSSSSPVVQLTCYQLTHLCHCIPLPAVSSPAPSCMTLPAINSPVPLCIPLFPDVSSSSPVVQWDAVSCNRNLEMWGSQPQTCPQNNIYIVNNY